MQGAGTRNRFGFQSRKPEEEDSSASASGFHFGGAWSDLNTKPAEVGHLANVTASMRSIIPPARPKTPVVGCSTNVSPRSKENTEFNHFQRTSTIVSPRSKENTEFNHFQRTGTSTLKSDHDPQALSGVNSTYTSERNDTTYTQNRPNTGPSSFKRLQDHESLSASIERTSTTASFVSTTNPLLRKDHAGTKLSRSVSHNNLGALVAKLSTCSAACNRLVELPAQHSTNGDSQQSSCLPASSCVSVAAQNQTTSFISSTPKLWVNKHRPESLSSFVINCRQAHDLKQLISAGHCHHLLFEGPPGCGKKSLIMALLRDAFGISAWLVRDFTRTFDVEGTKVSLPIASSAHHVELNLLHVGVYLRPVLTTLLKEMKVACTAYDNDSYIRSYKVLVLHDADEVSAEAQQHIRWLMDRYSDYCKFMLLCCSQPSKLSDSVRLRCIVVDVHNPTVDDVVQVLYFVAKRENLDLQEHFAWRIAKASKNFRQAVLSLEACKLKQYPFDENQVIAIEWENDIVSMARDIIDEQNPRRLYKVKRNMQKLLDEGVAAKLILWRLVDELIKLVNVSFMEEINQWAKFYAKRTPDGIDAIFKLEEFVAKLMSLYKKYG
ncbi:replication factor C subunit 5 [Selaginella moellendorffii]|uniref:replication factor C subunit 5 n=1 Tax=Selaginella moellendorffii TaxID=88036 RepID=UPI000D1CB11B|nr:replication factor C subunit 5 [Selaginella moellendorffii]|eukprot:XP_024520056.1 replication factor C subunit 5 [Selaginella moellendorffii]